MKVVSSKVFEYHGNLEVHGLSICLILNKDYDSTMVFKCYIALYKCLLILTSWMCSQ